jgi:hypothetical protein
MSLLDARPPNALTRPQAEIELPEERRPYIAWLNAGGSFDNPWLFDQDGHLIPLDDHGKNSEHGWHVHRIHDGALGGRYTASNIVARHWRGNISDGGRLGAILRNYKP